MVSLASVVGKGRVMTATGRSSTRAGIRRAMFTSGRVAL